MKRISPRNWMSGLASAVALSFSLSVAAQVLETPQTYTLDPITTSIDDQEGIPITLDAGVIAGLNSQIGNVPLNDVVVASNPSFNPIIGSLGAGKNSVVNGQFWSLVHTSPSDTRALAVASPVNLTWSNDCEDRYEYPTSLQILDLTGDGLNDLAFMGPPCDIKSGFDFTSNIWGLQGNAGDPFQDADSLTVLGNNLGGSFYPATGGGQLALVQADFNGDGLIDLAYYNVDSNNGDNSLQTLLNDGGLGLLPTQVSPIDGPVVPTNSDAIRGVVIVAGDFDGNGTQDIAVAYSNFSDTDVNELQIYSGNGDGSFAQTAMAQANLEANDTDTSLFPRGMTSGNFDGNDTSDFAVSWTDDDGGSFITTALCDGSQCNTSTIDSPALTTKFGTLVAADFNSDGLDDLANIQNVDPILFGDGVRTSTVTLRLNNGGGFDSTIDQTLTLDQNGFDNSNLPQLVAEDLDACGGPDLAFTGYVYNLPDVAEGSKNDFEFQTGVAFNINEAPVANAGPDNGTRVNGGIQLGGNPTCSDPTNDAMEISWTQTSGQAATLNDPTAANPIITSASGTADAEFQVTCTDACGLSDSDTVTVDLGLIQGGGACSLNSAASGFSTAWLMIPAALGLMTALRRKKS